MSNIQRYAASFLSDESLLEPGDIFRKLDGTLWYVDTNGDQQSLTAGGGGSQNLGQVLTVGNDGSGLQAKNLAEGTDPADAATVSQLAGGGLPTGWTADSPNIGDFGYDADGRTAALGPAGDPTDPDSGLELRWVCLAGTTVELFGGPLDAHLTLVSVTGGQAGVRTDIGIISNPDGSTSCFQADGDNGATVALHAGGLD